MPDKEININDFVVPESGKMLLANNPELGSSSYLLEI